jgi:hypothetical protein
MNWRTLPGPAQVALAWAVNIGGHAWTSELADRAVCAFAEVTHDE